MRVLAISAAVIAGPLLATAASTIGGYTSFEANPDEDGFSLDGVFIGPEIPPASQSCGPAQMNNGGCTVWGGGGGGYGGWWGGSGGGTGGGYDTTWQDHGGSGDPPPTYADYLTWECEMDDIVDFSAQQIMNAIKDKTDWNEREYGAVVYMVNGEIKVSALTRGETVAEAIAAGRQFPETRINFPADLGDGVILAVVHSHPDVGYDVAGDIENKYPSLNDYDAFDTLVGAQALANDPRFANNVAFSQYILGPDGVLREFNKKEGRVTSLNDLNPGLRSDLWRDRQCQ
jgi:hypothetical protein